MVKNQKRPGFPSDLNINPYYKELIEKCWDNDPKKRPTFKMILFTLINDSNFHLNNADWNKCEEYIKSLPTDNDYDSESHALMVKFLEENKQLSKINKTLKNQIQMLTHLKSGI